MNFNDSNNRPRDVFFVISADMKRTKGKTFAFKDITSPEMLPAQNAPRGTDHRANEDHAQRTRFSILSSPCIPPLLLSPLAQSKMKRGRENIAIGVRVSRGRTPAPFPLFLPRGDPSPLTTSGGGCLAIVTLALLIACPTKVYHYHRHPSWPAQRTESPRFALYILFSIPLPQASSSLFLHLSFLSFSLSRSFSLCIPHIPLHQPSRIQSYLWHTF